MNPNPTQCPGCGQEVAFVPNPEGQSSCPNCGGPPPTKPPAGKFNWLLFLGMLLTPALLSLGGAIGKIEGLAVGAPVFGGAIAGLLCGISLARHVGRTSAARLWLGFLFVGVFAYVSFMLSFFGCLLGGYQLRIG